MGQSAASIALTSDIWKTLHRANDDINASLESEDDLPHYGVAEYWTIPTDGYGDCEDYALAKRKRLVDAGLPRSALRIAVVKTPRGIQHAVLTVTTDEGVYVLDSLDDAIVSWSQTDYEWLEAQDPSRSWQWVALNGNKPNSLSAASAANIFGAVSSSLSK